MPGVTIGPFSLGGCFSYQSACVYAFPTLVQHSLAIQINAACPPRRSLILKIIGNNN